MSTEDDGFKGFEWKGKTVRTYGEIGDAACALETAEEAGAFLDAYRSVNQYASSNIGYLMGYYGPEERERVYRLMDEAGRTDVQHPVFGGGFGRGNDPTPKEAFEAGARTCHNADLRIRRSTPEARKQISGVFRRWRYGISVEDQHALFEKQGGRCGGCGVELVWGGRHKEGARLDHHHGTGRVRGYLCARCNGLMRFLDLPAEEQAALRRWHEG